jgi:hypothetical protein
MPATCPYGGRCRHANGHYLTRQRHARYLTLEEREIVLPSPRPWDFPPSIDGDISHADDPMELDDPE